MPSFSATSRHWAASAAGTTRASTPSKPASLRPFRPSSVGLPTMTALRRVVLKGAAAARRLTAADLARDDLRSLAAGQAAAAQSLTASLADYVALLRSHIAKENHRLFPMTDRLLSAPEQAALEEAFDRVEREEMGAGVHERYHQLAHELAEK